MSQSEPQPHVYSSGAKRSEKLPMYRLIPKAFLKHLALAYTLGNAKYENGSPLSCNWRTGDLRFFLDVADHLFNHVADFNQMLLQHGVDLDKTITDAENVKALDLLRERNKARTEQMIEDLAHAAFNCAALIEVLENGQLTDMMLREVGRSISTGAVAPETPEHKSQDCNCILSNDTDFVCEATIRAVASEGYNSADAPAPPAALTLELGKRYVRRDGVVTGALEIHDDEDFPFWDPVDENSYTPKGEYYMNGEHSLDLIKELHDAPTPTKAETEPTCEVPAQAFAPLFPGNTPSDAVPSTTVHRTCRFCGSACTSYNSRTYGICLDCRDKIIDFCKRNTDHENTFHQRKADAWEWSINGIFETVNIETAVSTDRVRDFFTSLRGV